MHYSAKRGIAIACRLSSVRVSVCDVGGSGPKKLGNLGNELHGQLAQHLRSSYRSTKAIHPCLGEHGELSGRLEVGWVRAGAQKPQYL